MNRSTKLALAAVGGLVAVAAARSTLAARGTERVPYETVDAFDGVELRRYPQTILVETTAESDRAAFGRLFRYISGGNEREEDVPMTAPVATDGTGESISMTAPVRTSEEADADVTMAFYLPAEYSPETVPVPTDPRVRLVVEPARTVAVRTFSWWATDTRVERETDRLLGALAGRGVDPVAEPTLLRYDAPWTPPFLRTNEVAVTVEA